KGDEIARGMQSQPSAAAGDTPTPAPVRQEDLPQRGWLLHYGLDIILPVLLGLVFLIVLSNANDTRGWNWKYIGDNMEDAMRNPAVRCGYNTMAMSPGTAAWWAQNTFQFLVFGIPLLICFLYSPRPLRFGLGIGAVLLAHTLYVQTQERESWSPVTTQTGDVVGWVRNSVLHQDRSYFGILRIHEEARFDKDKEKIIYNNTYLMHGTTHHGLNYQHPRDLRRLATTYYHRNGPVGIIMRQIDWFAPPRYSEAKTKAQQEQALKYWNTYPSDARLPASLIGQAAMPIPGGLSPFVSQAQLVVDAWSDPPYACVGLGTGTMASYCRPFQHLTFYEIDNKIRSFSERDWEWPDGTQAPYFNYVQDARKRGARIEIIMGDARFSMAKERPQ